MINALESTARRLLLACLVILAAAGTSSAQTAPPDAEGAAAPATQPVFIRLLCIGNSFSYDATAHLRQIVTAAGHQISISHASLSGCSLERHWRHTAAFEANPDDPEGRPYGTAERRFSLKERLVSQRWDYITIQQASMLSFQPKSYQPYAGQLAAYIRTHAPDAQLLVHQTWAYDADDPMFGPGKMSQQEMYNRLRAAYARIADAVDARLLPVGDAFQLARRQPAWQLGPRDPEFDFENAAPPNLPRQQGRLTVGYVWRGREDNRRLALDAHHANLAGRYLAAAVWFETLYGQSVIGNSYVPKGLTAEQVDALQHIAHAAVAAQTEPSAPAGAAADSAAPVDAPAQP